MKIEKTLLAFALALPLGALAENQDQLVSRYTSLAGSQDNAKSLVSGLRDGKAVTLTKNGATETFTPPTRKMGYGNVDNALGLAQASLKQQGIENPTPAQLETAVMDVLQMRADGKGWGEIAKAQGVKLGDVKRADRTTPPDTQAARGATRPERPAKPERPERAEKPEKPGKPR